MKIKIKVPAQTIQVDVEDWALEYGIDATPTAVRDDVREYFRGWCQHQVDRVLE